MLLALSGALLAIALAGYGLWHREQAPKSDWDRRFGFPTDRDVTAIAVRPMANEEAWELQTGRRSAGMEGSAFTDDAAALEELMLLLHQSPRTGFGDPEPSGELYVVELRTADGRAAQYAVNDMRAAGYALGSKIYPLPAEGREEVWRLSPRALELLIGPPNER